MLTVMRSTEAVRSAMTATSATLISRRPPGIAVAMTKKQATPTTLAMTFWDPRLIRASEITRGVLEQLGVVRFTVSRPVCAARLHEPIHVQNRSNYDNADKQGVNKAKRPYQYGV